jgi:hypothetical protein
MISFMKISSQHVAACRASSRERTRVGNVLRIGHVCNFSISLGPETSASPMFAMSGLERITDSSRTSREVRKLAKGDVCERDVLY